MRYNSIFLTFIYMIALVCYLIIALLGDYRANIEIYWVILIPVYAIYGLSLYNILNRNYHSKYLFLLLLASGIIARLLLIPTDPILSDDVFRYLWDGKISGQGINPYLYAPSAEQLSHLRDQIIYPYINFPEIATVYPAVSQLFFLINYWLGGTLFSWKAILLISEVVLFFSLSGLIKYFRMNKFRIFIYFLNPLLIIETYQSGHLEIIGLLFLWVAIYLFYTKSERIGVLFFPFTIMTKFVPLISILPFLSRNFLKKILVVFSISLLLILPFCFSGIIPLPGLFSYINRWEFNGAIFQTAAAVMKLIQVPEFEWMTVSFSGHTETFYISIALYYKLIALIVLLVIILDQTKKIRVLANFRSVIFLQRSFILTAAFLLLTPTLHPWYLLWLIPFLIFIPNWSWMAFTMLIQLSYFVLRDYVQNGIWEESFWIILAQYLPFYVLLIWEYFNTSRIKGWLVKQE